MPDNPRSPVPRTIRCKIVSAWSSSVCPTATTARTAGAGCFTQPGVPGAAGVGLEMAGPRRPPLAKVERQAKLAGQLLDKRRIGPRSFPLTP